jgi:hypothetical protein
METVKPELFTAVFENLLMSGQSFFFLYKHILWYCFHGQMNYI